MKEKKTKSAVDALLKEAPFSYQKREHKELFTKALKEELCFHYQHNDAYRQFCQRKNFNPELFTGVLEKLPPVAVSVFKELGENLRSVPQEEVKISLQSSATSGKPSTVVVDKTTAKRQAKAMVRVMKEFIGADRKPFVVVDVSPQPENFQFLGARYAAIGGYLNFASEVAYALELDQQGIASFQEQKIEQYIQSQLNNDPMVVFGFTYILFSYVVKTLSAKNSSLKLPKGSKIIHIGGWKKLESEKISKQEFNAKVAEAFGIEEEDVIDIYGFTEQMGLNYPDCSCGYKHTPAYSEVLVRDPATREVLPSGKEGLLEFISPIQHSYPGNVVLTDDLGTVNTEACPAGREGTRFKVVGRLKKAEIRGCGDILSSKLKFQDVNIQDSSQSKGLEIHFWKNAPINQEASDTAQLNQVIDELNQQQVWLQQQPIDALIGLIGKVAEKWLAPDSGLGFLKEKGLSFLANWSKPEHLNKIASLGLRGNRQHIEGFQNIQDSRKQFLKANPRGLVAHWLAGNVQVLGMFALIQSILTKNVNLLKVSGKDDGVFASLLHSFEGVKFSSPSGYTILGDDLIKTIGIVYFSSSNKQLGELMSQKSKARIAWGGREAVQAVAQYPANFDTEDIIFGPKLSFSVIAQEVLKTERKAKKLARKVAVDVSVFDQTGCASPHNLYIEKGGVVSPEAFCSLLAEGLEKTAIQIPKTATSPEQIAEIHSIRGVYDFKGSVHASADATWTVLFSDGVQLNQPVYSRVIFVHAVEHLNETLQYIDEDTQTIGLGAEAEKALTFATQAVEKGVMRLPEIGRLLNFESPWDGIFIMERLVRWSTLGGPLV